MIILEREVGLMDLAKAIENITCVERSEEGKNWYELRLRLKDQEAVYVVTNARQNPRKWAQINTLVSFVKEQCPVFVEKQNQSGKTVINLCFGATNTQEKETK